MALAAMHALTGRRVPVRTEQIPVSRRDNGPVGWNVLPPSMPGTRPSAPVRPRLAPAPRSYAVLLPPFSSLFLSFFSLRDGSTLRFFLTALLPSAARSSLASGDASGDAPPSPALLRFKTPPPATDPSDRSLSFAIFLISYRITAQLTRFRRRVAVDALTSAQPRGLQLCA